MVHFPCPSQSLGVDFARNFIVQENQVYQKEDLLYCSPSYLSMVTVAESSRAAGDLLHPVDVLVLRPNGHSSLLDTLFVSRRSRRTVYAVTTRGPQTFLWRVASNGSLTQVAQINWDHQMHSGITGDGSLKRTQSPSNRCEVLIFNGKMQKTEEFLRKGKGWFPTEYVSPSLLNSTF